MIKCKIFSVRGLGLVFTGKRFGFTVYDLGWRHCDFRV
jgi:hypothetical protein